MMAHELGHLMGLNHPFKEIVAGKGNKKIIYDPNVIASDVMSHNPERAAPSSINVSQIIGKINLNVKYQVLKGVTASKAN
ncbi:MAG TPA: hypothetical protein PK605_14570 [Ignavibacteria bacterium]|nr:hypothetical protein [Bacteroidota bacterium]HRE09805.1 hypothetical protein [Ignavibacteria bacterium]HRF65470.1 hypothetical protein [Ignavibacteria bacterium]HRJ05623.1 hypothetical protein [Ignavibacteria bacterium]